MVSLVYFCVPSLSHTRVHTQSRAHTRQLQDAKAKLESKKLGEEAKRAAADAVTSTNFQVKKTVPDCAYGIHTLICFHTHMYVGTNLYIHTHMQYAPTMWKKKSTYRFTTQL